MKPDPRYSCVVLDHGEIRALVYLPDAQHGYYRGTRFDWSTHYRYHAPV